MCACGTSNTTCNSHPWHLHLRRREEETNARSQPCEMQTHMENDLQHLGAQSIQGKEAKHQRRYITAQIVYSSACVHETTMIIIDSTQQPIRHLLSLLCFRYFFWGSQFQIEQFRVLNATNTAVRQDHGSPELTWAEITQWICNCQECLTSGATLRCSAQKNYM